MSKVFEYFKKTGGHCDSDVKWDGDKGYNFSYEVEDEDLIEAVVELVSRDYFDDFCERISERVESFIKDKGLLDRLSDVYYEELKEYFEDDAFDGLC